MSAPALVLGPGLVPYLVRRGASVTLRASPRHGCCGGTVAVPVAELGAPTNAQRYDVIEREGVRVYLEHGLLPAATEPVTVGLEGFGPWRRLWVSGLESQM